MTDRLDELDLDGQMVGVVRRDAPELGEKAWRHPFGPGVLHPVHEAVTDRGDRFEKLILTQPVQQKLHGGAMAARGGAPWRLHVTRRGVHGKIRAGKSDAVDLSTKEAPGIPTDRVYRKPDARGPVIEREHAGNLGGHGADPRAVVPAWTILMTRHEGPPDSRQWGVRPSNPARGAEVWFGYYPIFSRGKGEHSRITQRPGNTDCPNGHNHSNFMNSHAPHAGTHTKSDKSTSRGNTSSAGTERHRKTKQPGSNGTARNSPQVGDTSRATNFVFYTSPALTLACIPSGPAPKISLSSAARISGVHQELLLYYCRTGLLGPDRADVAKNPVFDAAAINEIERIEHYRRHLGVQRKALHLVEELWREGERLRVELRFLQPKKSERFQP